MPILPLSKMSCVWDETGGGTGGKAEGGERRGGRAPEQLRTGKPDSFVFFVNICYIVQ